MSRLLLAALLAAGAGLTVPPRAQAQSGEPPITECSDDADNDGNGLIDFPEDPGCTSIRDRSERSTGRPPACADGVDNDGDGDTDYPSDPDCRSASGTSEGTPPPSPQCSDGRDNDGDGRTDHPAEPGCTAPDDTTEVDPAPTPACADGADNDGDGRSDWPADPDCAAASGGSEGRVAQCHDGLDNDGDGRVDHPADPGCGTPEDDDESGPSAVPECADGRDNDGDGRVDFPADDGCTGAEEDDEAEDPGPALTPCQGCICNADLDGDGETDGQAETADCEQRGDGAQCPLQKEACEVRDGARRCPSGPAAGCARDGDGTYRCSRHACFARGSTVTGRTDVDQPPPRNDGSRDDEGRCLGTLRIFAGQGKRCRRPGTQTVWQDCCRNKMPKLDDTMGETGGRNQREYKEQASTFEAWDNQCDIQDQETALLAESGYCVTLGDFCAERWVTGCVQRSKAYCCFNSKLAKLIQEQGRPQLPEMGGFGTAEHPRCGGFTLEQFQALDFSKIDLSGYYASFRHRSQDTMRERAQGNARENTGR